MYKYLLIHPNDHVEKYESLMEINANHVEIGTWRYRLSPLHSWLLWSICIDANGLNFWEYRGDSKVPKKLKMLLLVHP